jgi:uncharacterized protein GlcG (DUF336 family)
MSAAPGIGRRAISALAAAALMLVSCGGGGQSAANQAATNPTTPVATAVFAVPGPESLSVADVGQVLAQAIAEAQARNLPSFITVTDRVGNVLANYRMTGAPTFTHIDDHYTDPSNGAAVPIVNKHDFQGLDVPSAAASIAKAVTASYLSSGGNAFTTRTASEIVQEHFPPALQTPGLESGPLFGVQFSSLPCSDLSPRYVATGGAAALIGPKRTPLGLSADPGGIPLYKNGVLVGGIGVEGDGAYRDDTNILDVDNDPEEFIAIAGSVGFAAPDTIMANRITVDGTSLRFSDATPAGLLSNPATATPFAQLAASVGALSSVRGYYAETGTPAILAGAVYGTEASGIRKSTTAEFNDPDTFILSDGSGNDRFPVKPGTDTEVGSPLTATEVQTLLEQAFSIMRRARGQIRQPLDSRAEVSISVVDTRGVALGTVRAPDAPLFGTDVSLQKARTAAFFSGPHAYADLTGSHQQDLIDFANAYRTFVGNPQALTGETAFTDRANGNLSRPYFPDGQLGTANGPFSHPITEFNPFSTGLQSALIAPDVLRSASFVISGVPDTPQRCTALPNSATNQNRLQNGIQIFPGSVPIYRGSQLIGGIGVSGDGIDQDDMISFLGLYNAGLQLGTINEAPTAIRSDQLVINGVRLRFVGCPFAPFVDTSEQNVCDGK